MNEESRKRFCETLDQHHEWPCIYVFKFIVPQSALPKVEAILHEMEVSKRNSKTGKYVSVTAEHPMESSEDVADIYAKICEVEGAISL